MADNALGRFLSKSIRHKRGSKGSRDSRGSFDVDADSSSIGSDDVTPSRGRSIASRKSERADTQSHDSRSTHHGITFEVPDVNNEREVAEAEDPGLVSYDSEDPDV